MFAFSVEIDYISTQGDGIPPSISNKNRRYG